jgi:hypothetical protein
VPNNRETNPGAKPNRDPEKGVDANCFARLGRRNSAPGTFCTSRFLLLLHRWPFLIPPLHQRGPHTAATGDQSSLHSWTARTPPSFLRPDQRWHRTAPIVAVGIDSVSVMLCHVMSCHLRQRLLLSARCLTQNEMLQSRRGGMDDRPSSPLDPLPLFPVGAPRVTWCGACGLPSSGELPRNGRALQFGSLPTCQIQHRPQLALAQPSTATAMHPGFPKSPPASAIFLVIIRPCFSIYPSFNHPAPAHPSPCPINH